MTSHSDERIQSRLLYLAGLFISFYAIALLIAPIVRTQSGSTSVNWQHISLVTIWIIGAIILHRQLTHRIQDFDPYLIPIALFLNGWGVLTIWRLIPEFGLRQTLWLGLTILVLFIAISRASLIPFLRRYKYIWLVAGLSLTAMTLVFGTNPTGFGPRLWLGCCGLYLQPTEPLKLLLIIYLSAYFSDRHFSDQRSRPKILSFAAPTLLMGALSLALLLVQRDLGTAVLFIFIYSTLLYLSTGKKRIPLIATGVILAGGAFGYFLFDVVRVRMAAWANPWSDPAGGSFQIVQSLIAAARGGLFGAGPGLGNPGLVPVAHSDFILISIAEEFGLLGTLGIIGLFSLLIYRGLRIALGAKDRFRGYLAAGVTAYLGGQAILIIGGNMRLLPLTGVTLPFVSYGGSSLITAGCALLVLLHCSYPDESAARIETIARQPILAFRNTLMLGLIGLAIISGWWTIIRRDTLIERPENSQPFIEDRFSPRGRIIDRNDTLLAVSFGEAGELARFYHNSSASNLIGYSNPRYGQSGLESGLDPFLRGELGVRPEVFAWNRLIFGSHPAGTDVRLSIDSSLITAGHSLLDGQIGAFVLLNANTGEILALGSSPSYDANQLEEEWQNLISNVDAPLLNRATQGGYPPGTILNPFLYGFALDGPGIPDDLPDSLSPDTCAANLDAMDWPASLRAGCEPLIGDLIDQVGSNGVQAGLDGLGFYSSPDLPLQTFSSPFPVDPISPLNFFDNSFLISPIQVAQAAAIINGGGILPPLRLLNSIRSASSDWQTMLSSREPLPIWDESTSNTIATELFNVDEGIWETSALVTPDNSDPIVWYLGGTLRELGGAPLVIVVVLEGASPEAALQIGRAILVSSTKK